MVYREYTMDECRCVLEWMRNRKHDWGHEDQSLVYTVNTLSNGVEGGMIIFCCLMHKSAVIDVLQG